MDTFFEKNKKTTWMEKIAYLFANQYDDKNVILHYYFSR